MGELTSVGKPIMRSDALDKVTGRAIYCADIKLPGMLTGVLLYSPYALSLIHI